MAELSGSGEIQANDWEATDKTFTIGVDGKVSDLDEFAMPFAVEVDTSLKEGGFRDTADESSDIIELLGAKESRKPTAAAGIDVLTVSVIVAIGSSFGSWAVGKLFDEVYTLKIRPSLKKLSDRFFDNRKKTLRFKYGSWYAPSQVFIHLVIECDSKEEFAACESLIPQANQAAIDWIQKKGIEKRVITYRIKKGKLDAQPMLGDVVPK